MASWAIPCKLQFGPRCSSRAAPWAREAGPLRHFAWLGAGIAVAFLVPYVLADRIGGLTFVVAIAWRGIAYGACGGLLLSALQILVIFVAHKNTRLRERAGFASAVGAVAIVASTAMTAVNHAACSSTVGKPVTGDLAWSIPTLATPNPIGAPTAQVALHVTALFHNDNSNLSLAPQHWRQAIAL